MATTKRLGHLKRGECGVLDGRRFIIRDRWSEDRSSGGVSLRFEDGEERKIFASSLTYQKEVTVLGEGRIEIVFPEATVIRLTDGIDPADVPGFRETASQLGISDPYAYGQGIAYGRASGSVSALTEALNIIEDGLLGGLRTTDICNKLRSARSIHQERLTALDSDLAARSKSG